jgi:hypothetical protein
MVKTLSYRIFGLGKLPKRYRAPLEAEQIVWLEEGVRGSVTLRKYKAPGKRFSYRRVYFSGAVGMTRKRVFAFAYSRRLINVPFKDARIKQLSVSVENKKRLHLGFEAGAFDQDRSGTVECRFSVKAPEDFLNHLNRLAGRF